MKTLSRFVLILLLAYPVLGDIHRHPDASTEKLGTVSFPVSCAAASQPPFERGVALLHSFWYDEAEKQFEAIARKDPDCAMAYWGQAMSLYHQLWERPTDDNLKLGAALVKKAQQAHARTPRERDYIAAAAAFYRDDPHEEYEQRARDYSEAMKKVYERHPEDHEAAVFYALSLLASAPEHDPTLANRRSAIAILTPLFEKEPDHPGVAHYLIHAADNPQLAAQGLPAARRYAEIAPASPHALHMPSHIFARLGLWQEDIQSNLASVAAAQKSSQLHVGSEHQMHAMDFLLYAYLQIGEDAKAKALVDGITNIQADQMGEGMNDYYYRMQAHFPALLALETRQWKTAGSLEPPSGAGPNNRAITYWARTVAAGHVRDADAARAAAQQYDAMVEAIRKSNRAYMADYMEAFTNEVHAWLAFAEGRNTEALNQIRSVADEQDADGKGETDLPAREMLADMLLALQRPQEALAEYEKSMRVDPNRFNGLYGAATAAESAHQELESTHYYALLLQNCHDGVDSNRPEILHAKALLAKQ